jgi:hypothetical protein
MSYQYCTPAQVKLIAKPEVDVVSQADEINALINGVSAWIDKYTGFPEQYFSPAADDPSDRRFRGENKPYLRIGRHVGDAAITSPTISPALIYTDQNGWLRYNDSITNQGDEDYFSDKRRDTFFSTGTIYIVSARWGFEATPDDIVTACALIVGDLLDRGAGVIGQVSPSGFVIERTMPLAAREILNNNRRREFQIA